MEKEIKKFLKKSVKWLKRNQQGCCRHILDDHLAIFVGWSAGYGNEKRKCVIQAKDNLDYGINAGLKVWTSDDMWTDFDWLNFPYYDDGDVLDMSLGIKPRENYGQTAKSLLEWYDEVKDIVLDDNGRILEDSRYDYKAEVAV